MAADIGRKMVFATHRDGKETEIYAMNANGSNLTRLTNDDRYFGMVFIKRHKTVKDFYLIKEFDPEKGYRTSLLNKYVNIPLAENKRKNEDFVFGQNLENELEDRTDDELFGKEWEIAK